MRTVSVVAFVVLSIAPCLVRNQSIRCQKPQPSQQQDAQAVPDLLDINTATLEQLKALPGFGYTYARRVIAGRPYVTKTQLLTRGVLPLNAYNKVAPLIIAHHLRK